jgi:hypothetical protein
MLNIKCHLLHNPLINCIAGMYDKHTREFVIHGQGRILLTPESVYRTLGLPQGQLIVPYCNDPDIEACLGPLLSPGQSSTPKTSLVGTILEKMTEDGVEFKQIYLMHLVSTLLNPNICNKVSNRCYPLLICVCLLLDDISLFVRTVLVYIRFLGCMCVCKSSSFFHILLTIMNLSFILQSHTAYSTNMCFLQLPICIIMALSK